MIPATARGGGGGGSSSAAVEPAQAADDVLAELTDRLVRLQVAGAGEVAGSAGGRAVVSAADAEEPFAAGLVAAEVRQEAAVSACCGWAFQKPALGRKLLLSWVICSSSQLPVAGREELEALVMCTAPPKPMLGRGVF